MGRKNFKMLTDCEFWQPFESKKPESLKSISVILRNMESHLAAIREFLENETK